MFEWDENKAAVNQAKHGVSFDEASSCFMDPLALILHDIAHSKIEDRYISIARSARRRILTIVFTLRSEKNGEKKFRIISARQASKKEKKKYSEK